MVHISEIANSFVKDVKDYLTENQEVKVKVLNIGEDGKIGLSIKKATENTEETLKPAKRQERRPNASGSLRKSLLCRSLALRKC